jgi:glycosyltransferase involved in cell wall biosynthesis
VQDLLEQLPEDGEIIVGNDKSTSPEAIKAFQRIAAMKQCRVFEPTENLGRARIRNKLFELSLGEWVLFIDADTKVDNPDFISNYLKATEEYQADAFCGGMKNTKECPKGCELRWTYETQTSRRLTKEYRQQHPYESLTAANIMLSRAAFVQTGFLEEIVEYGYEDVILIQQLKHLGKSIHHIYNPLIHLDIDNNKRFLAKTRQALRTLHSLSEDLWPETELTRSYKKLRKLHLHRAFALIHLILLPITRRLLNSRFAPICVFQCYKLGYFCGL